MLTLAALELPLYCLLEARVFLDVLGQGKCSYFNKPTLKDFSISPLRPIQLLSKKKGQIYSSETVPLRSLLTCMNSPRPQQDL